MDLVDVRRTDADKQAEAKRWEGTEGQDDYPYGLSIHINDEVMAKLGLTEKDFDAGQPVVAAFILRNLPRHAGLLLGLLDEAERAGQIAPRPPLTRLSFAMGAVVAPVTALFAFVDPGLAEDADCGRLMAGAR